MLREKAPEPKKKPACPEWVRTYFLTGDPPERDSLDHVAWARARFFPKRSKVRSLDSLWRRHREELLEEWARESPGKRPAWWWQHETPELRRVLPGQGVVVSDSAFYYTEGIPLVFPEAEDELVFVGKVKMESEAAFLRRHGLLTDAEKRRLKPSAFRPVVVGFGA